MLIFVIILLPILTFTHSFDATPTPLRLMSYRLFLYLCSTFRMVYLSTQRWAPSEGEWPAHSVDIIYIIMKLYGMAGKGTGKKGSDVYAISGGEQIVRQYNPIVSNPNTDGQVSQRARFKLASQLSAALAPSIVIPKKGLLSARNQFVKKNMDYVYGNAGGATASYENLQLTDGNRGLPAIHVEPQGQDSIQIDLVSEVTASVSRVVYNVYEKTTEDQLQLALSRIVPATSENSNAAVTIVRPTGDIVIYAYGMTDKNSGASAKYGNYQVQSGQDIAALVASRKLSAADFTFTQTRGVTLLAGDNETPIVTDNQVLVYVTPTEGGSVSATGLQGTRIIATKGQPLTITANAQSTGGAYDNGYDFAGWYYNGQQVAFSTTNPLTITPTAQVDIVAKFVSKNYQGLE